MEEKEYHKAMHHIVAERIKDGRGRAQDFDSYFTDLSYDFGTAIANVLEAMDKREG